MVVKYQKSCLIQTTAAVVNEMLQVQNEVDRRHPAGWVCWTSCARWSTFQHMRFEKYPAKYHKWWNCIAQSTDCTAGSDQLTSFVRGNSACLFCNFCRDYLVWPLNCGWCSLVVVIYSVRCELIPFVNLLRVVHKFVFGELVESSCSA